MRVLKDTPFELGFLGWKTDPARPAATFVAKATFAIAPNGPCTIAPKQEPCSGELHHDDEETLSVRLDSDMALLKPRAECFLAGSCHAPGGRPATAVKARFTIGPIDKVIYVVGDRRWSGLSASEPAPFTSMRLAYERAFGGPGYAKNPVGRGIDRQVGDDGTPSVFLPNLENPRAPISSPLDRPDPWGSSPIPRTWQARATRAGTYNQRWLETRWPWFPEDFDAGYFNAAPADQQIEQPWNGDETIRLENLHPEHAIIETKLPGLRPRCFVDLVRSGSAVIEEVPLRLDTITVDSDRLLVMCVWRGLIHIEDEKLASVKHAYLAHEAVGDPRPAADHVRAFQAQLAARVVDVAAFAPEIPKVVAPEEARAIAQAAPEPMTDAEMQRLRRLALGIAEPAPLAPPEPAPAPAPAPPDARRAVVLERVQRGEALTGMNLAGVDLSGLDLRGAELTGLVLSGARFDGAKLDGAKLDKAILGGASLAGASLAGASLREADLSNVIAPAASFDRAVLEGATLEGATLTKATFRECTAGRADFSGAELAGAIFDGARLPRADLSRSVLELASFVGAAMQGASLEGARAAGARFERADVTKLRASDGADLTGAMFMSAEARGALFGRSNLSGANFSYANLQRADFSEAKLEDAVLNACILTSTCFRGANLARATVMQSKAFEATFEGADMTNADLRGASLYGSEFLGANVNGVRLDHADVTCTKLAR